MSYSYCLDMAKQPHALLVFAHGAGADKSSEFIEKITLMLVKCNISVLRFNFPYMDKRIADGKRRPPDRMPKLINCFAQVLTDIQHNADFSTIAKLPLFIGGKSMGSRVAATLISDDDIISEYQTITNSIKGVICLGYPFHPQNKPESLRLAPLQSSNKPTLIIQGDRDKLGCEKEILGYELPRSVQIKFLADGDHDLKPRVKSGLTHQQHLETSVDVIGQFILEQRHA